jgi:hypothetical protein
MRRWGGKRLALDPFPAPLRDFSNSADQRSSQRAGGVKPQDHRSCRSPQLLSCPEQAWGQLSWLRRLAKHLYLADGHLRAGLSATVGPVSDDADVSGSDRGVELDAR